MDGHNKLHNVCRGRVAKGVELRIKGAEFDPDARLLVVKIANL